MAGPTVYPASTLRALIDTLSSQGLDRERLVAASAVPTSVLEGQGAVPSQTWAAVWAEARVLDPWPALPTRTGLALPFGAFGLVDYLSGSSPTLRAGLEALVAHFGGVASLFTFELDPERSAIWLMGQGASPRDNAEFAVAVMVSRLRELAGDRLRIVRVELDRDEEEGRPQDSLLGARVVYACPRAGVTLDEGSWDLPSRMADPGLFQTLEALAARLDIGPAGPHLEGAVRARIRARLSEGALEAAGVAHDLGLSERTLARRLAGAGTRFRRLLDEERAAEACRLLLAGRTVAETALEVGYAEQSAFTRAFRRWTGQTPTAWLSAG